MSIKHEIVLQKPNLLTTLIGLMFIKDIMPILIKTRFGIHTFFVQDFIDVIVCDSNLRVVKLKSNLRSFSFFFWPPKYNIVIELPKDFISSHNLKINDIITINERDDI